MPRKPKREKQTITVVVNGAPVAVILHPPTAARKSWYAYWAGLVASKSTGQSRLEDAIVAAEAMVRDGGKRPTASNGVLTDEEFEAIQRAHFERKHDTAARARSQTSLDECLGAMKAFGAISGLQPIAGATADDCAAFQRKALTLPKNWRLRYPNSREEVGLLSANTVLKWSRSLQAAFERANRNASKRKCVRGVVDERKLLVANPWNQFPWIEGRQRPIRQFDSEELVALLDYFEKRWTDIPIAGALAKVFLWSGGRRLEVASLTWPQLRVVGSEHHFEVVGKWGVEKWFRVPEALHLELQALRTGSPFVFAAYSEQLRKFYEYRPCNSAVSSPSSEFDPKNLANWFYKKLKAWSRTLPKGTATTHIFRKTSLQYARIGEDINREIARDARVSETVLMAHYVKETDEELRAKSNRTYKRIVASLSPDVARRYGCAEPIMTLQRRLEAAVAAKEWAIVQALSARLASKGR